MIITSTVLPGAVIIEPRIFRDARGWQYENWSKRKMEEHGLRYDFVQENISYTAKAGTLRGLHFQKGGSAQAKLVSCLSGEVLDVIVDIRRGSPTYKKWLSTVLSSDNRKQLLVPRGFAHGFLTLTDNVAFCYKLDNFYDPQAEMQIRWNDPDINADWGIENPLLSEKDASAPYFKAIENFLNQ
jgi:dTDP-4-dehydrorhamnose 3,5-epimerase